MNNSPCDVKILYDTEFEAQLAASKAGYNLNAEMIPYRCGAHWHIANKDRTLRSRVRPNSQRYCQSCNAYMKKKKNWIAHIAKPRHIAIKRKRETIEVSHSPEQHDNSITSA